MPIPLIPLIGAGAALAGQVISATSQNRANRKGREFAEKMYNTQRQDALADWTMQNEYNHPSSQMARLREAGLNPNLVYGNGAKVDAGPVRSSSAPAWKPEPVQFDTGAIANTGISSYYDTQIKQAQIDNLRTQNTAIIAGILLKEAQLGKTEADVEKTKADTRMTEYQLEYQADIRPLLVKQLVENIERTSASTTAMTDENQRRTLMSPLSLEKQWQEIETIKLQRARTQQEIQEIRNRSALLVKEGLLKDFEIALNKDGLVKGDPWYYRVVHSIFDGKPLTEEDLKKMGPATRAIYDRINKK